MEAGVEERLNEFAGTLCARIWRLRSLGSARRSASRFWRLARNSSSSLVGEELVVVAGLGFRAVGVLVPLVGRVFLAVGAKDFGLAFVRPSLCWDVIAGLLGGHDVDLGWAAVLVGRVERVIKALVDVEDDVASDLSQISSLLGSHDVVGRVGWVG